MSISTIHDVEFGAELPVLSPTHRLKMSVNSPGPLAGAGRVSKVMRAHARGLPVP